MKEELRKGPRQKYGKGRKIRQFSCFCPTHLSAIPPLALNRAVKPVKAIHLGFDRVSPDQIIYKYLYMNDLRKNHLPHGQAESGWVKPVRPEVGLTNFMQNQSKAAGLGLRLGAGRAAIGGG